MASGLFESLSFLLVFTCLFFGQRKRQKEISFVIDNQFEIGLVYLNPGNTELVAKNTHEVSPYMNRSDIAHYLAIPEERQIFYGNLPPGYTHGACVHVFSEGFFYLGLEESS